MVEVELAPLFKDTELNISCFMGVAYLMLEVDIHGLQGSCGCAPMQPPSNLKSVDLSLVILTWRSTTQALSIQCRARACYTLFCTTPRRIESAALPTGEYLDIDSPCSLIAVVMKNSKPNPSPLPHLLS